MNSTLFEMDNVTISYGGKEAVRDMSISLYEGEILGIVGESGSGKTTTIKAAMGLLGNSGKIESGNIFYKGINITNYLEEEYRKLRGASLGLIFQDCKSAFCPIRTIESQLYEAVSQHQKLDKILIRKKALKLLEKLNFEDANKILKSYPFQLSGGMNQRVGIMMAMILEPAILFADEPTSALDALTQKQVVSNLLELRDTNKMGMVVVTHNIGLAAHISDYILVMKEGKVVEFGEANEVLVHPKEAYTKQLLEAVPRLRKVSL